jgi:hypothetical protein
MIVSSPGSEPSKVSKRRAFVPVEDETNRLRPTAEVIDREHVRIGLPLPDNQPATWLQHPVQLAQRLVPIRDLAQGGDKKRGVERRGREREVARVSLGGNHVRRTSHRCPAHQLVEHRLLQIENIELTIWRKLTRYIEAVVTGAGSDFEHSLARGKIEHVA